MTYIRVNGTDYPATIDGKMNDYEWDGRESKEISTNEMTSAQASAIFVDDVQWAIFETDEHGSVSPVWDNSDFCVAGDITDHRNGYITIKMGKPTDLELAYEELYG